MTDAERNGYDNLLLLCPNHHRLIDGLRRDDWPDERLFQIKADHERGLGRPSSWADDAVLERAARLILGLGVGTPDGSGGPLKDVVGANLRRLRLADGLDLHRTFIDRGRAAATALTVVPRVGFEPTLNGV